MYNINGTILSTCNYNNIHLTVLSSLVTITSFLIHVFLLMRAFFLYRWVNFQQFLGGFFVKKERKGNWESLIWLHLISIWIALLFNFFLTPSSLYHSHFQHHAADCSSAVLDPYIEPFKYQLKRQNRQRIR